METDVLLKYVRQSATETRSQIRGELIDDAEAVLRWALDVWAKMIPDLLAPHAPAVTTPADIFPLPVV